MQYDEFVGQVQHRARLASTGEAVHIIHATLQTLGERLFGEEAENLAAQLPVEIGAYLLGNVKQTFTLREFYERVSRRADADYPVAIYYARSVVSVLLDAVSPGEVAQVRNQLSREFDQLFLWEGEGGQRKSA